jgi:hypothetical protein
MLKSWRAQSNHGVTELDRLAKLRQLKSALMQDLLTGRVPAAALDLDAVPA